MNPQCYNPYLPSWEYVPDGEPYVFGGRLYVYGSHDKAGGEVFCDNDYVCWSASVDDLSDWRYEGVIYKKTDDPLNRGGEMRLFAPDVTVGADGRYYLYYVLNKAQIVSVAVCDTPAGKYECDGYVSYPDGTRLGEREGDDPQFDPGVLTEGDVTYLYTGFCNHGDKTRKGAMVTVLGADMLTVVEPPVIIVPGNCYGKGTEFEGHEYFEAASMRKFGDTYYFIYSSTPCHELCYATSKEPTKNFTYGGVIVSNCDMHIDSYKPAELRTYFSGNNHGSIIKINDKHYIFYHRQTNGTWYSRQGCVEEIKIEPDGSIRQVEKTSQGMNGKPLTGRGEYSAHIACVLFHPDETKTQPKITQDGKDGDKTPGYITDITDGAVIGFKYFDCNNVQKIKVKTRASGDGFFEVKTALDGKSHGEIQIKSTDIWTEFSANIDIPDGKNALYFVYKGSGNPQFSSFEVG